MKVKLKSTMIGVTALIGLSACTPRQVAQYLAATRHPAAAPATVPEPVLEATTTTAVIEAISAPALPAGPTLEVIVDCTGLTLTARGWPAGTMFITGYGWVPPYGFAADDTGSANGRIDTGVMAAGARSWSVTPTGEPTRGGFTDDCPSTLP